MGYTTTFRGKFKVTPALNPDQVKYLQQFSETRRMTRDATTAASFPDPVRERVGLPVGENGAYFIGNVEDFGQRQDKSVLSFNDPPSTQPGLWCQWIPSDNGKTIEWDGGEKFYEYVDWIHYIIDHFLTPWGCHITGDVRWKGESRSDKGVIQIKANQVSTLTGVEFAAYVAEKKQIREAKKEKESLEKSLPTASKVSKDIRI